MLPQGGKNRSRVRNICGWARLSLYRGIHNRKQEGKQADLDGQRPALDGAGEGVQGPDLRQGIKGAANQLLAQTR